MGAEPARPRPRIESLSDLIFGLALSIGAIGLIGSPPATVSALYGDIVTFGFNFVVIISIWIRYTRIMSVLPLETKRTIALNTALLFCVSLEPFLFNILRSGSTTTPAAAALADASSALYGLDLGVMMAVLGVFTIALADEERRLVPREMTSRLKSEATTALISGFIFMVSAAPVFDKLFVGGTFFRTDLWLAALVVVWVTRRVTKKLSAVSEPGADSVS